MRGRGTALLLLVALLLAGCTATASPKATSEGPRFTLKLFNLRAAPVVTSGNFHVGACRAVAFTADEWTKPMGEVVVGDGEQIVDLPKITTEVGYAGVVSVVIDSSGAKATIGDTDLADLPPCEGA